MLLYPFQAYETALNPAKNAGLVVLGVLFYFFFFL